MVIDGKRIAESVIAKLKARPIPAKYLAAVLVEDDPASASFVAQKGRVAKELGVDFRIEKLKADSTEDTLIETLKELGKDGDCGGIILQLPLPAHLDRGRVVAAIPPEKDVDALRGELVLPPAVGVVEEILRTTRYSLSTTHVAVVGLGFLVGRPITKWLEGKTKELITLDIGDNLVRLKEADVVILGAGKAGLVKPDMLKNGAFVIDFGYSMEDGKLRGDFDPEGVEGISYTPTPGGTGPILVAKLFENFYTLAGAK
jgi:methylenetetrahydrofolate dehydrogenase (NADP+)/methenyltetrahydrofolate cyclohydrolase